jgi:hypothetical protein
MPSEQDFRVVVALGHAGLFCLIMNGYRQFVTNP